MNRFAVKIFAAWAAALLSAAQPAMAQAQTGVVNPAAAKNKVVFQVSDADPAKWNLALNNAKNVQEDLGADAVQLEIVVYGPGIGMLKQDSVAGNRVGDALKKGVAIVACENTMTTQKLAQEDMLPNIGYVKAGVVELMKKQQEGYAYIRP